MKKYFLLGVVTIASLNAMQQPDEKVQERYKKWIVKQIDTRLITFINQNPTHLDAQVFQRYFDGFAQDTAEIYANYKGLKTFAEVAQENLSRFPRNWNAAVAILGNAGNGSKPQSERAVFEAVKRELEKRNFNILKEIKS